MPWKRRAFPLKIGPSALRAPAGRLVNHDVPCLRRLGNSRRAKRSKRFFFEKKKQKTFALLVRGVGHYGGPLPGLKERKFFASFFQKRSACLPFLTHCHIFPGA
jgi:hypothetical protein